VSNATVTAIIFFFLAVSNGDRTTFEALQKQKMFASAAKIAEDVL